MGERHDRTVERVRSRQSFALNTVVLLNAARASPNFNETASNVCLCFALFVCALTKSGLMCLLQWCGVRRVLCHKSCVPGNTSARPQPDAQRTAGRALGCGCALARTTLPPPSQGRARTRRVLLQAHTGARRVRCGGSRMLRTVARLCGRTISGSYRTASTSSAQERLSTSSSSSSSSSSASHLGVTR